MGTEISVQASHEMLRGHCHRVEGVQVLEGPSYVLAADLQLGLVCDSKMEQFPLESQEHRSIAPGLC